MSKIFDINRVADQGILIAVEGIDFSGKSTAVNYLVNYINSRVRELAATMASVRTLANDYNWDLEGNNPFAIKTEAPGYNEFGLAMKKLLLSPEAAGISDRTMATFMTALRNDQLERVIGPALDKGAIVVTDRYLLSTHAYQADAGEEFIDVLHELIVSPEGLGDPQYTIIMNASLETAKERRMRRTNKPEDRFDADSDEKYNRRIAIYKKRAALSAINDRIIVIDADRDEANVQAQLEDFVDECLLPDIWGMGYDVDVNAVEDDGVNMS